MIFGLFGSSSAAAAQVRAAKHMDDIRKAQAALGEESEMAKAQRLAYDPERWPHCMDTTEPRRTVGKSANAEPRAIRPL